MFAARLFTAVAMVAMVAGSSGAAVAAAPAGSVKVLATSEAPVPVTGVRKAKRLKDANNAAPVVAIALFGIAVAGVTAYFIASDDGEQLPASP